MAERDDVDSAAEERLVRARQSISRSFDELISRVGSPSRPESPVTVEHQGPTEPEEDDDLADPPAAARDFEDDEIFPPTPVGSAAVEGVEARLNALVNARVEAAERRLELQSKALEAALGEEAVSARRAAEQVEAAREALDQRH